MKNQKDNYKWYILGLIVLTNMIIAAIPTMGMSVMAKEISEELGLTLVQVGIVWGGASLSIIVTSLFGGMIGDKIGPKRVLVVCTLLAGLLGAARGLTVDFISMTVVVILVGALIPFITINNFKTAGQWFQGNKLGLANGLISMGMAVGFLLGSMFSATVLSPLLGGWRNVLIVYGLAGALLCIPWFFVRSPETDDRMNQQSFTMRSTIAHVARQKNIWLLGFTFLCVAGSVQGLLGYLPIYLRGLGWEAVRADGALTAFHTISMVFVLPAALWSDRLGSRKRLLMGAALMTFLGLGLLSFATGGAIWVGVLIAGFVRDAFMAIFLTLIIETDHIGPAYAGTATGFVMAFSGIGNVLAPPLGNSMASLWPGAPFAFWAVLAFIGIIILFFVQDASRGAESIKLENAFATSLAAD